MVEKSSDFQIKSKASFFERKSERNVLYKKSLQISIAKQGI